MMVVSVLKPFIRIWKCWMLTSIELLHRKFGKLIYWNKGYNTNFIKEMQQTGYTQNHRLSFSNGNDDSNYRASIGVIDQKGIIKNNTMRNYTAKIDAMQNMFHNKLKLEIWKCSVR